MAVIDTNELVSIDTAIFDTNGAPYVVKLMDEGVCSTDLQSRPIRLSVTRTCVRKSITLADNKCFLLPTFFVYTVDKEAVTSCKFAMQAADVCVRLYVGQV